MLDWEHQNRMVRPCSGPASKQCRQSPKTRSTSAPCHRNLDTSPTVIGIDISKNSFHILGQDQRGAIVLWQKWSLAIACPARQHAAAVSGRHGGLRAFPI